ncbi:endonuclease/exonuclease/phosphatase family protein [Nocardioides sp. URHA0020]|uniref:endonuclease/exonuclease/phosphatase family protein n=1 Tax=Nocardioides sp. URHA0020 TaxID=1380392 RepID=UPI00048DCBE6|nr:endonuclease/exonuclease/phosphatase family protein [Nocardioides sp. URHA0020]
MPDVDFLASLLTTLLLVVPTGAAPASHAEPERAVPAVIRVGTFNVDRGTGYAAWRRSVRSFRRHVDVAGLQEVNTARKRHFLADGDRWGYYARTPGPDVNPVIWDRRDFRRTGAGAVRLAGRHGSFAPAYATLVRLVHRRTGQRYAVLDVHLAWGHDAVPRRARRAQLVGLARAARREEAAGRHVLVVGDFNVNHRADRRDGRAGSPTRRLRAAGLVSAWDSGRLRAGGGSSTLGAGYIDQVWAQARAREVRTVRRLSGGQHHPVIARYAVPAGDRPAPG